MNTESNKTHNDTSGHTGDMRILILEDDELDVRLIEEELAHTGIHCTTRHTDDEASFKKELGQFKPGLILSDFCLPSYDGFLALDEVRTHDADVPFIFVSGAIGEDLAIEALKRGATDCVNKNHIGHLDGAIRRAMKEMDEKRQRRRAEEALERLRRRNIMILDSAGEGIAGLDEEMRFVFINRSALDMLGYGMKELIGEAMEKILAGKTVPPVTDTAGTGTIGLPGQATGMSLFQLRRKDGSVFPAEFMVNAINDLGGGLGCVISFRDVSARLKAEEEVARSYERMRTILFESIHAMSTALEFRDPYTAGHQKRVAELASAIALRMDLPEERRDGIYLAGIVHDIGKIYVPAEILTRPGKLSDVEFRMIQVHSETGFRILKDVDYPWPIAQAVYQHHERIDGSGYPRGLLGDDIILDAKIISVADVVEAMASHRPYRPAIGMDMALDEIRKGAGKIYDTGAAMACLELFREGFEFS